MALVINQNQRPNQWEKNLEKCNSHEANEPFWPRVSHAAEHPVEMCAEHLDAVGRLLHCSLTLTFFIFTFRIILLMIYSWNVEKRRHRKMTRVWLGLIGFEGNYWGTGDPHWAASNWICRVQMVLTSSSQLRLSCDCSPTGHRKNGIWAVCCFISGCPVTLWGWLCVYHRTTHVLTDRTLALSQLPQKNVSIIRFIPHRINR